MILIGVTLIASVCGVDASTKQNLALNPGFEFPEGAKGKEPERWNSFASKTNGIGITSRDWRSGRQCVRMAAQRAKGAYQGLLLDLPAEPGERYSFSAYIKADKNDRLGGTTHCLLTIEWLDENGKQISKSDSKVWGRTLSRLNWKRVAVEKATAPEDAVLARCVIQLKDGEKVGSGSIFVDDVLIRRH